MSTRQNTTTGSTRHFGGIDLTQPRFLSKWPTDFFTDIFWICSIDIWNIFLHLRQVKFIFLNATVPEVLAEALSQADYSILRRQALFFIVLSIFSLAGRIYSHSSSLTDGYAPLLWSHTACYSHNNETRAIIYSALEDMTSKIIVVPIIILLSLFHDGIKMNPLGTVIAGVLWVVGSAVTTALRTAFLIKATNWYGPGIFLNIALLYEILLIVGYVVFIQVLAPLMLHSLPEGPAKATINDIASKAGYSLRHDVYLQPQVDGRSDTNPNAYHIGMFGTSMIVISESLMKLVGPADIGAVVAHEIGHWYHNHSAYTFTASVLINSTFTEMATWSYGNEVAYKVFNFDMTDPPHPIVATLLVTKYFFPIFDGFMTGLFGIMRYYCEFTADGFAVRMGLGTELRRSLVAICSKIEMFPGADSWYAAWFRAHPSIVLRIQKLSQ